MIKYIKDGDLFESKCQCLVCTVNCKGAMGKGIALEFKKRFPALNEAYKRLCQKGTFTPGKLWYWDNPLWEPALINHELYAPDCPHFVLCFPTKDEWRNPSKLEYIEAGLQKFVATYNVKEYNGVKVHRGVDRISSIAFPKLGCKNGGLDWKDVKPLMEKYLADLDCEIEIYE